MKLLKFIISLFLLVFIVSCENDFKVLNPMLIGKWQLAGLQTGNTQEWIKVVDSVPQIKEFRSDGKYFFSWGESI
ncbi:MAG: hypothetical protein AMS27_09200 [Bacteroides sp. SM23_62_1]|nr:MAG: hypothetical protein AMS27_09200 [Bacteroides sp. SM23_62_1]